MNIFRSIGSVIAGSLTIMLTAFGANSLFRTVAPGMFAATDNPLLLVLILCYTAMFSCLGGYVSARLSGSSGFKHAIALGILQTIGSAAAVYQAGDALPGWYAITVLIFPLPVISLGGYLSARKHS